MDWVFSWMSRAQFKQHSHLTNLTLWYMIALYRLPESTACLYWVPADGAWCWSFSLDENQEEILPASDC